MNQKHLQSAADQSESLVALVQGTAHGDRNSFAELYRRTAHRVHGLTLHLLVDRKVSEDTTLEVFQTVWERAATFDPASDSPMTWLMSITHRAAAHRLRTGNRPVEHSEPACLDQLTGLQREALSLTFSECLTCGQAAKRLHVPQPVIRASVRSGLQQLKNTLPKGES
ncbi:sigma factor [Arthrobacter sp. JZ12]|uniref:sigma factor n=1 Tax=Arthrobacter sp. JZ12 TaxID=2654190 RepID=UPI002B47E843|nr:sigma factor [Arthrobacter sp. JZ12]